MPNAGVSPPYSIRVIITKSIYMCKFFFVILLLIFPREVLNAARDGLGLWFNNVLPALLPFIVAVNLLTAFGFVRLLSRWARPVMAAVFKLPGAGGFALITGIISGYPIGAKTVADLWQAGEITTKEAQRLLAFCNNAGPLFIVGVVGAGLLADTTAGYVLWAGHVAAALIIGVLTRSQGDFRREKYRPCEQPDHTKFAEGTIYMKERTDMRAINEPPNMGKALGEAVKNAMEALLLVGGLIIFFSVVVRMIMLIAGGLPFMGVFAGIIEITGGVKLLADASPGVVTPGQMAAIGGIIGFGGLSVHAQALHFTSGTGVRAGVYLFYKAINGVIAAGVTGLIWSLYM